MKSLTDYTPLCPVQLPDKDAPVDSTLAAIEQGFSAMGLSLQIVSERQPVSSCWSHHVQLRQCPQLSTNGKGETKEASLASGFAEMVERFATGFLFSEYALRKERFYFHPAEQRVRVKNPQQPIQQQCGREMLSPALFSFYDPDQEMLASHLMDSNYDEPDRGILTLPFLPLGREEENLPVYFPVALLDNLYVSNGMAAGNSRWECCCQAISEIFERHVKYTVIAEAVALADIPEERICRYPLIVEKRKAIEDAGCSLWLKDASLGGQFPVVCALLLDPAGGAFASFGCSCRLEVALGRALTEMLQGRELSQLQGFAPPETSRDVCASSFNLENHFINSEGVVPLRLFCSEAESDFSSTPWEFSGTTEEEFHHLCGLVEQAGYYGYIFEYDQFPLFACRIVIPGMSEVYPPDELLWNNRNRGSWLRPALLKLPQLKKEELAALTKRLEETELAAEQLLSSVIGVIFEEGSVWERLRIGEFKAMLYLALVGCDTFSAVECSTYIEEALHWCRWVGEYAGLDEESGSLYLLLAQRLALQLDGEKPQHYQAFFRSIFSKEELAVAEDILGGKLSFPGLDFGTSWEEISSLHSGLAMVFTAYQGCCSSETSSLRR